MPKAAHLEPSRSFQKNRRNVLGRGDAHNPGVFRVVTAEDVEVHFECQGEGGLQAALTLDQRD